MFHAGSSSVARIGHGTLLRWFREGSKLSLQKGCKTEAELRKILSATQRLPGLRQRQGFRWADPEGSTGVENLKGYAKEPLSGHKTLVTWGSYWAVFRLRMSGKDYIEIERATEMKRTGVETAKVKRQPTKSLTNEVITITAHSRCKMALDRRRKIKVVRNKLDLLPAIMYRPLKPARCQWTLIYLHGMNSSALKDYSDVPHYFIDGSLPVKVIIPQSPTRECSCYDQWWTTVKSRSDGRTKQRLMKHCSWYDYLTDRGGKREDDIDWQSLYVMQKALHEIIWNEANELGGRTDRIILGGKSQGCCTALDAALTFPKKLGGFIGVVGHILSCTPTDPKGPQKSIPLHFFHEMQDTTMRWEWVQMGEQRLRDAGYRVHSRRLLDPQGGGHHVGGMTEGTWVRTSLRSICSKRN